MKEQFIIIQADNTAKIIEVTPDFNLSDTILANPTAIGFFFARRV